MQRGRAEENVFTPPLSAENALEVFEVPQGSDTIHQPFTAFMC